MRSWLVIAGLLLAAIFVGVLVFQLVIINSFFRPTATTSTTIRYLQTITYEMAGTEKTVSGVREVNATAAATSPGSGVGLAITRVRGTALVLDDGQAGLFLALPMFPYEHDQPATVVEAACGPSSQSVPWDDRRRAAIQALILKLAAFEGPCVVPIESWPLFVRFSDPAVPETIERLSADSLQTANAYDLHIISVTIERVVNETVSTGLAARLPWLAQAATLKWNSLEIPGHGLDGTDTIRLEPLDISTEVTQ
jgi:hypothetical protein